MATSSSTLAWEIPWTEELDWLQFMRSQKRNPVDRGAWLATVHRVTKLPNET